MRWGAALVVAALGLAAHADPIARERLLDQIREGKPAERAAAAARLARQMANGGTETIDIARAAVISNDPKVRVPLIDALVEAQVIERASAVQIPTAAVLEKRIRQLLPKGKENAGQVPVAKDCRVVSGTARNATIECHTSRCASACMHETRTVQVTTGVRWKLEVLESRRNDDGSCGDCML